MVYDMFQIVSRRAARNGARLALEFVDERRTYADVLNLARWFGLQLDAAGLQPGDHVGVVSANHESCIYLHLAALSRRIVLVPINQRFSGFELARTVREAEVRVLFADPVRQEVLDSVRDDMPGVQLLTLPGSGTGRDGWRDLGPLPNEPVPAGGECEPEDDDLALLLYTSGTTGQPKGAMIARRGLWAVSYAMGAELSFDNAQRTLLMSPFSHVTPWTTLLPTWVAGGTAVLVESFVPAQFLHLIASKQITGFATPTALLDMAVGDPAFDPADLSRLSWVSCGGSAMSRPTLTRLRHAGVRVHLSYGMTEASGILCVGHPDETDEAPNSCGRPVMLLDMCIKSPDGAVVTEAGVPGEVCMRGDNVIKGYWRDPASTAAALDQEGWWHTGDLGYVDAAGRYVLIDRLKDMVKTGGENVSASEVERVLIEHPAVAEVAVIGTPHPRWGEQVTAVVRVADGQRLELAELREFAGQWLSRFKLPVRLEVLDELPRNATGKIVKGPLRDRFARASGLGR